MPRTADRPRIGAGTSRRARFSKENRQGVAVLLAAVVAPLVGAAPIGTVSLDVIWCALIGALAAYLGSTAKRGPLLLAAIVALVVARSFDAGAFAVVAAATASLSTRHLRHRAFFARGLAGGAAAISVLATGAQRPAWIVLLAGSAVGAAVIGSGYRNLDRHTQRTFRFVGVAAAAFAVAASALAGVGALGSAHQIDAGTAQLELGLASARQGDALGASTHLQLADLELQKARKAIDRWGVLGRVVPFTAQHVEALSSVLGHAHGATAQAIATANATKMDDLTVESGRLDTDAIADLEPPFRRLALTLDAFVSDLRRQDHLPLVPAFKRRLQAVGDQAVRAQREAHLAAEGAREAPELLGAPTPKHYLVLFTSPSEARGRFGFPASFAEVTMDHGRFLLGEHGSISALLSKVVPDQSTLPLGDDLLRPYVSYGVTQQVRTATVPPDFPTVAAVTARMWTASGRTPVDGVLRFDPAALAGLVALTGPVRVPSVPTPLTAANLEQFLVFGQYVQFPTAVAPRREVLQTVADTTFERLLSSNLPSPRALIDLFSPLVRAGHLDMASFDRSNEAMLADVGIDGRLAAPTHDGVMVANINSSGNKIDAFLTKAITYRGRVTDGRLQGSVSITLTNHAPASGLPAYVIGSTTTPPLPDGTNRMTLLVYTAVQTGPVLVDGQPVLTTAAIQTGGWWLRQVPLVLGPGASRTVRLSLGGRVAADGGYQLRLEPGGGATPETYDVRVTAGGRTISHEGPVPTATVAG